MSVRVVCALMLVALLGADGEAAAEHQPDLCLEVTADAMDAPAWERLVTATEAVIAERTALFPDPQVTSDAGLEPSTRRLSVAAGHSEGPMPPTSGPCRTAGLEWGARFSRAFLDAGAARMLAEAPTTPGIGSRVDIAWLPLEGRLTTTLVFAGPLDIPNGTCWIDETLTVDVATGQVRIASERGVRTSPFAEGACGRFFDHLPHGGAGGQALSLLPMELPTDSGVLRLHAREVAVTDEGIVIGGTIEEG